MKVIVFILGTGMTINFPFDPAVMMDCVEQGKAVLDHIATYHGPGPTQGWILKESIVEVAGWYCK